MADSWAVSGSGEKSASQEPDLFSIVISVPSCILPAQMPPPLPWLNQLDLWSLQLLFISIICIWIQLKVWYIFIHMSHQKRLCEEDPFVPTAGQRYAIKSLSLLMTAETPPMMGTSLGSHGSCALASYGAMTNSTLSALSTWYRHWKQIWINLAYKSFWLSKTPTLSLE